MTWTPTRLRYVADLNPAVRADVLADLSREVSFLPMEAVGENGSLDLDRTRPVEQVRNGYSYFENGDVAMAKVTPCFENGKGAIMQDLVGGVGFGTTELTVLRPKAGVNARFLRYFLASSKFMADATGAMTGAGGLKRVPDWFVRDYPAQWPDGSAQERIANFLDEQTARLDALLLEKSELLRQIDDYLDSQTSFLLSGGGIAGKRTKTVWRFLEELPAHWSLCHLRWISKRVEVGIAEAATHAYADTGVPILRSTNVRANRIEGSLLHVEPWFAERNASKTLYAKDLVTVRTGYPGVTAVVPQNLDGCQCFTMLITTLQDGYLPEFYARYLNSAAARGYFEVESWGSAQKNISVPILKDVYVPRLPIAEQASIAAECRRVEESVEGLASHVSAHIDRLREYRSSLISAAVTGQLDFGDKKTLSEERLAA